MRRKNKLLNIKKDMLKRKKFLKIEIKRMVLLSIFKNSNVKTLIKMRAKYYIDRYSYNKSISKQKNNICLKSGRIGGVFNRFNFSRHEIKKVGINNNLQNFKITGW